MGRHVTDPAPASKEGYDPPHMELTLEDFVPYDQSSLWRIHDSYFAGRGGAAWSQGEIPSMATSSYAMARQQAKLVLALVGELEAEGALEPGDPVRILEVGSGSGKFAAMFLRALERGCGEAGAALLGRIRYMLSDYSETNLKDALGDPEIARRASEGLVAPALLDLRRPAEIRALDGRPVEERFAVAIANYVCCVTPLKILQKTREGFLERRVKIAIDADPREGESPEAAAARLLEGLVGNATRPALMNALSLAFDWQPVDLARALPDPVHRRALEASVASFDEATPQYPFAFLEFVRTLRRRLLPGGMLAVNDYGTCDAFDLDGRHERAPVHYGNTLNHGADFPVIEEFCRAEGLAIERTRNPLLSVQTAAIRLAAATTPRFHKAFHKICVRDNDGQTLLELRTAAVAAREADPASAARLYRRALRLDPDSAEIHFDLGQMCFASGHPRLALRYLRRGRALDPEAKLDFAFQLGRVYVRLNKNKKARRAFEESLRKEENASTHANLGIALENLGLKKAAYRSFRRALEIEQEGPVATAVVRKLLERYLPKR